MNADLLRRLDAILSEANDAIDAKPNSKAAELLFGPVQDLAWAVDQLSVKRPRRRKSKSEATHDNP